MEPLTETQPQPAPAFIDRRQNKGGRRPDGGPERRQFRDAHSSECYEAIELGEAIDRYKLEHRRRFITYEELYHVIRSLGYRKA